MMTMTATRTAKLKVRKQEVWISKTLTFVHFLVVVVRPQHETS